MSTIAAALQIPATPVTETTPAVAPIGTDAASVASEDFILALTKALSGAAPAVAGAVVEAVGPVAVAADEEPLTAESLLDEEAAAAQFADMLVLPWVPPVPVPAPSGAATTDALDLLGVTSSAIAGAGLPSGDTEAEGAAALTASGTALLDLAATADRAPGQDNGPLFSLTDRPAGMPAPAADVATAAARTVQTNVGAHGWSEELGTRLTLMAERGQHTASLRLSPEHLGPLEIRIAIRDDQASVWFGAAHADTRAAIEHALPRSRELFAAQGMTLTDAGVSREPPREQVPMSRQPGLNGEPAAEAPVVIRAQTLQRIGLIDAYA